MIYLVLAFVTGIILVVQMYMNSQLSARLDQFNGVFYNYFVAVVLFSLYFIVKPGLFVDGTALLPSSKAWMLTGGSIGVIVVAFCNISYKKLSATYTTSFIILGQLAAAMFIDKLFLNVTIAPKEIIGILLILIGIASNTFLTNKNK